MEACALKISAVTNATVKMATTELIVKVLLAKLKTPLDYFKLDTLISELLVEKQTKQTGKSGQYQFAMQFLIPCTWHFKSVFKLFAVLFPVIFFFNLFVQA